MEKRLQELIKEWRAQVNPACHFCAKQLEAILAGHAAPTTMRDLRKRTEEEKS